MINVNPEMQFVLGRECPDCANDPDQIHIHSYLHEDEYSNESGHHAGSLMVFHSRLDASRYVEECYPKEINDIIIMPLAEANFPEGGHKHKEE